MRAAVSSLLMLEALRWGDLEFGRVALNECARELSRADDLEGAAFLLEWCLGRAGRDWPLLRHQFMAETSSRPRGRILLSRYPAVAGRQPTKVATSRPRVAEDLAAVALVSAAARLCLSHRSCRTGFGQVRRAAGQASLSAQIRAVELNRTFDFALSPAAPVGVRLLTSVASSILRIGDYLANGKGGTPSVGLVEVSEQRLGNLFQDACLALYRRTLVDQDVRAVSGRQMFWAEPGDIGFELCPALLPDIEFLGDSGVLIADCKATGSIFAVADHGSGGRLDRTHLFQLASYLARAISVRQARVVHGALIYAIEGLDKPPLRFATLNGSKVMVGGVRLCCGVSALLVDLHGIGQGIVDTLRVTPPLAQVR
jgi:hypothetical protein